MHTPSSLTSPLSLRADREALAAECLYFGLDKQRYELLDGYNPYRLSEEDFRIREQEDRVGANLAEDPATNPAAASAMANADHLLVNVFEDLDSFAPVDGLSTSAEDAPLLFTLLRAKHPPKGVACPTIEGFRTRLNLFSGPLLEGLDMTNMVIAGGSVVRALTMGDPTEGEVQSDARKGSSDIDIFCTANDPATAMATFQRLLSHVKSRLVDVVDASVQANPDVEDWEERSQQQADGQPPFVMSCKQVLVTRTKATLTIVAGWPQRHIQFILRHYGSTAAVILGFDIDICKFAYGEHGRRPRTRRDPITRNFLPKTSPNPPNVPKRRRRESPLHAERQARVYDWDQHRRP